jgi:hypothetical protein
VIVGVGRRIGFDVIIVVVVVVIIVAVSMPSLNRACHYDVHPLVPIASTLVLRQRQKQQ